MLNRRILRIKAFKAIYSYAENRSMTLAEVLAQTEASCEATRDLYIFLLGIAGPLTAEAAARTEAARAKFNPSEEERNPNMKFIGNKIAPLIAEDPDFKKIFNKKKMSWDQYDVFIRHLYDSVKSSEYFREYMESPEDSLAEDAGLWERIFTEEFEDNEELEAILEDLGIWWNDDIAYALNWCCRTMEAFAKGRRWNLPELYLSEMQKSPDSDRKFIRDIVTKAVTAFDRYYDAVAALTEKWDKSRICPTDLAIIAAGAAEHESHPEIPTGVTINEYVEISKFYTPESRSFVNGILDKLLKNN